MYTTEGEYKSKVNSLDKHLAWCDGIFFDANDRFAIRPFLPQSAEGRIHVVGSMPVASPNAA